MSEDIRIDLADARKMIDSGEAVVLDVVSPPTWEQMHKAIAGAIRINPREIEDHYKHLPKDKTIVAYCT